MEESVIYSVLDGVAQIIINRPQYLNALNVDVLKSLQNIIDEIHRDYHVKVAIISGAGDKAFVAGADIAMLNQLGPLPAADYIELGQRVMRSIEKADFPVIAAVNGYALGGGLELALACDIIIASSSAKLGVPEVSLGIIPGFGGTQRLIQRCGIGTARMMVFTGDIFNASSALNMGLVDKVAEENQLQETAMDMAKTICTRGPVALKEAKRLLTTATQDKLLSGLQLEVETFLKVFNTSDREEGMTAFLQKRKPEFTGH